MRRRDQRIQSTRRQLDAATVDDESYRNPETTMPETKATTMEWTGDVKRCECEDGGWWMSEWSPSANTGTKEKKQRRNPTSSRRAAQSVTGHWALDPAQNPSQVCRLPRIMMERLFFAWALTRPRPSERWDDRWWSMRGLGSASGSGSCLRRKDVGGVARQVTQATHCTARTKSCTQEEKERQMGSSRSSPGPGELISLGPVLVPSGEKKQ
jgi:hypothetical protein